MKKLTLAILFAAFTAMGPGAAHLHARQPLYLILRPPARKHSGEAYYPGQTRQVRTHRYSYGWFGVRPRQHLKRSTGYHDRYIQWARE